MKICILSMQRVKNFGSLLQSYALKKIIEELGHEVNFIDIEKNEEDDKLIENARDDYGYESKVSKSRFDKIRKIDKYFLNRLRIKNKQRKQNKIFELFFNEHMGVPKNNEKFDTCVIGSDEVFNCATNSKWGFTTQLFGNVYQAKRVITYAASCGSTEFEKLPEAVTDKIRESFKNISSFSVRDNNTHMFVSKLTDKEITDNLDPVLVWDFNENILKCNISNKLPNRYCIVYSYYNRINNLDEIKAIKAFCKEKKLTLVTIGAPQMWIKDHIVLSPFEVLAAFKNADFVITDTFHGTIFSVKYAKRFAVILRKSNKNKLADLIDKLKINDNNITSIKELNKVWNIKKSDETLNNMINKEKKNTLLYLKSNL